MKQQALELFGYCVGFLNLLAKPWWPDEPITEKVPGSGPCPADGYETGSDQRPPAKHLVQIGVIALDYRPNLPGASALVASSGRQPLGPIRIIASVG